MINLIPTITCTLCLGVVALRITTYNAKKHFKLTCTIIGLSYISAIFAHITNQLTIIPIVIFGCSSLSGFFEILSLPDDDTENKNTE